MRRLSEDEWREAITEQRAGTESQHAFCMRKDISVKSFGYWKKRLEGSAFIEIPQDKARQAGKAELLLPGGMVLKIEW